jgi:hypothetical protein
MSSVAVHAEPDEIVKTVIPLTRLYLVCLINDVIGSWPNTLTARLHRKPGSRPTASGSRFWGRWDEKCEVATRDNVQDALRV